MIIKYLVVPQMRAEIQYLCMDWDIMCHYSLYLLCLAVLTTVVLDAESPEVRDVLLVLVVLVMLMLLLR